jgi:hypothetical protein
MRGQVLEPVGQPAGQFGRLLVDDDEVEPLLFERQVPLQFDEDGRPLKKSIQDNPNSRCQGCCSSIATPALPKRLTLLPDSTTTTMLPERGSLGCAG